MEAAGSPPRTERCDWTAAPASRGDAAWERLRALVRERAYERREVTLASGKTSDFYIDGKQVTLDPEGARLLARIILRGLDGQPVDAIGGLTIGADPIAGAVIAASADTARPLKGFIVRKQAKAHGKQRQIEGPLRGGDRAVVVEDVVTTGGSILDAVRAVEEYGCQVTGIIVLVDRQEGGREALEQAGYPVWAIMTRRDVEE
jgi:orotate phosphoribosyltransferase